MESEHPGLYTIAYYAADELRGQESHCGPLAKAANQAICGMIKHLFSGVDQARIFDGSGREVHALSTSNEVQIT